MKPTFRPDPRATSAAIASGVLHALAYPGANLWFFALIAYVPLLWWLRTERPNPKRAFVYGLLAGVTLYLVGHGWIAFTLETMSHMPKPVAWAVLLIYALGMGLHQAVWASSVALLQDRFFPEKSARPLLWVVMAASVMTAVEHVVPFQFPWYLGNALYIQPVLMQIADIAGIWGVTWACVALSGWCWVAWEQPDRSRIFSLIAVGLLMVLWIGYGSWRMADIASIQPERTVTAALIQPNPTIAEKTSLKPKPRIPLHDRGEAITRKVLSDPERAKRIDLVVWPEGSLPFFYVHTELPENAGLTAKTRAPPVVKNTTARAHRFHKEIGKPMLIGALRRLDPKWRKKARNSAILLDGKTPKAIYDKKRLVPFGEYLPGTQWFPSLANKIPGVSDLQPGDQPSLMSIAGVRFGVNICYEALFADFMADHVADADVLINLTDDLWFGPTAAPEQHLMVQYPRAIELRRPLLRATATGVSTHIDALGRVHGRTGVWEQASLIATAEVRNLDSIFRHVGLWPVRVLSLVVFVWIVIAWRKRRSLAA